MPPYKFEITCLTNYCLSSPYTFLVYKFDKCFGLWQSAKFTKIQGDFSDNLITSKKSKIESSVQIIGELNQDEIKAYINKATVVIIPSMAEGLPNVAVESLSSGRPVVASNVGGVPEIIEHNKNGFLFEAGNKTELAKLIIYCVNNPHILPQLGINGRRKVEENFTSTSFASNYYLLYQNE